MRPAAGFLQVVDSAAARLTGRGLAGKSVLDFGCGYGRMLRLLPWFTDRLYGCDPWEVSLQLCEQHRVWGQLARSEYLPEDLPFGEEKFDVVLAFSVFTHTSARALRTALAAIRRRIAPGGLLVATIRPPPIGNTSPNGAARLIPRPWKPRIKRRVLPSTPIFERRSTATSLMGIPP